MNNEKLVMNLVEILLKTNNNESVAPSKDEQPIEVGKAYLFRTVTHIELGRVEWIRGNFAKIVDASWIADTGRYHDCLKNGTLNEVEPYPRYSCVHLPSLINFAPWDHELPTEQK
jgi:hypothetical protein